MISSRADCHAPWAMPTCNTELSIDKWTGRPGWSGGQLDEAVRGASNTSILWGIGNDIYQWAEALIEADENPHVCSVEFQKADRYRTIGASYVIPSLQSGRIQVRPGSPQNIVKSQYGRRYGFCHYGICRHAERVISHMNVSTYARLLRRYIAPHFLSTFTYSRPFNLDETLIVHLRSGDANKRLEEWFNWKREDVHRYFLGCVNHRLTTRTSRRVLIVSQHGASDNFAHPAFELLQSQAATGGWELAINGKQDIYSDFATLMHARHLCIDYCSYSWGAAMLSRRLRTVYVPHLVNPRYGPWNFMAGPAGGRDEGTRGMGFSFPASPRLRVYHISPNSRFGARIEEQPEE